MRFWTTGKAAVLQAPVKISQTVLCFNLSRKVCYVSGAPQTIRKQHVRKSSKQSSLLLVSLFLCLGVTPGCNRDVPPPPQNTVTLVFRHARLTGNDKALHNLIARFEKETPGILVKEELLATSPDQQHDGCESAMERRTTDFDVIGMDPTWIHEFARNGWLRDVSRLLPSAERTEFFPASIESASYLGKLFAVPWLIDAGVLYYRKDLLRKYNRKVPETWQELVDTARYISQREPEVFGFLWDGKEGKAHVTCTLEYLWSNGGAVLKGREVIIDSPECRYSLEFMRDLAWCYRITPKLVILSDSDMNRQLFSSGKALFLRDWTTARSMLQAADPQLRGKIGVAPLPSFPGRDSVSMLTGQYLGINRYTRAPQAAERFVRFLSSQAAQKYLATALRVYPSREVLYRDRDIKEQQPYTASLATVFSHARPEPVTANFPILNRILQQEFSAVMNGVKSPEEALHTAQETMELSMTAD